MPFASKPKPFKINTTRLPPSPQSLCTLHSFYTTTSSSSSSTSSASTSTSAGTCQYSATTSPASPGQVQKVMQDATDELLSILGSSPAATEDHARPMIQEIQRASNPMVKCVQTYQPTLTTIARPKVIRW